MPAQTVIKLRRDTSANWISADPTLADGEISFDTTAMKFKVGDGTSAWTELDYASDPESVVGALEAYAAGAASAAQSAAEDYADSLAPNYDAAGTAASAVTAHNDDTTSVHGIADTTVLLTTAGGTLTGYLNLHADPTQALQAATKEYVDNVATGIVAKPQVLGATTANIDATYNNGVAGVGATLTHNTNGVFPSSAGGATGWKLGSGILVKNQTNKAQNGRYYISDMGSSSTPYILTRCSYCDTADEIPGAYIFVQSGTNAGTGWIQVVADPSTFVVGTDNIDVFQFSGAGTYTAGNGLTLNATQFSVDGTVVPIMQLTSPTDGQTLIYNESTGLWNNGEGGSSVEVSEAAPSAPEVGDVWFNSANAVTYIYYDGFWVELSPALVGPAGPDGAPGADGADGAPGLIPLIASDSDMAGKSSLAGLGTFLSDNPQYSAFKLYAGFEFDGQTGILFRARMTNASGVLSTFYSSNTSQIAIFNQGQPHSSVSANNGRILVTVNATITKRGPLTTYDPIANAVIQATNVYIDSSSVKRGNQILANIEAEEVRAAAYPVSPTGILFDFVNTVDSTAKNATGGFWKLYGLY